jgi:hypothetical protein
LRQGDLLNWPPRSIDDVTIRPRSRPDFFLISASDDFASRNRSHRNRALAEFSFATSFIRGSRNKRKKPANPSELLTAAAVDRAGNANM